MDARHPSTPRLRRAFSVLGRRSFSEVGKAGHDELVRGGLRAQRNLFNHFKLICPVQSLLKKYFASRLTQIRCISLPVSFPLEGRIAIVTDVERDAVDVRASGARGNRRAR